MRTARPLVLLALLCAGASSLGCAFGEVRWADPLRREISLEDAQHRYTVLVRWSNFDEAAKFVEPERRGAYLASLPNFREFRFTEYESEPVQIEDELSRAVVEVKYYAYTPHSPIEQQVSETQTWSRKPTLGNQWFVESNFHGLAEQFAARE